MYLGSSLVFRGNKSGATLALYSTLFRYYIIRQRYKVGYKVLPSYQIHRLLFLSATMWQNFRPRKKFRCR